jgi:hypothetical protein
MESTGVYWRAVYYLLADEFECRLYNARHLRHVPGRRSDVQAAGATNADGVDPPFPELADVCRGSGVSLQIDAATRETASFPTPPATARPRSRSAPGKCSGLRRCSKTRGSTLLGRSEVLGVSRRAMLEALISGTHDPETLAELAQGAPRRKLPRLREVLEGRFTGTTRPSSPRCSPDRLPRRNGRHALRAGRGAGHPFLKAS